MVENAITKSQNLKTITIFIFHWDIKTDIPTDINVIKIVTWMLKDKFTLFGVVTHLIDYGLWPAINLKHTFGLIVYSRSKRS